MDTLIDNRIQREAADALLDLGVSVPLKAVRIPFRKKPLVLRLTMKRPTLAAQIRIARVYLGMGVTYETLKVAGKEEQMRFLSESGKDISRIIALTICRSYGSRHLLTRLMAWVVRNFMEYRYQAAAFMEFMGLLGTDPFMPIIRSVARRNPMQPTLSH